MQLPASAIANTTINLTGIVLLSLGISAAWSLFLYFNGAANMGAYEFSRGFKEHQRKASLEHANTTGTEVLAQSETSLIS